MSEPKYRFVDDWETVAVTPLPPGWRNVYEDDGERFCSPCPTILLQELRGVRRCWDEPQGDGKFRLRVREEPEEPPYETRAVFAGWCGSVLEPACEPVNYIGTIAPDQGPEDA